jgi:hypothetical protein
MSKFFQVSLQKEKYLNNLKANKHKNNSTTKNNNDTTSEQVKKKNTKKFMISPNPKDKNELNDFNDLNNLNISSSKKNINSNKTYEIGRSTNWDEEKNFINDEYKNNVTSFSTKNSPSYLTTSEITKIPSVSDNSLSFMYNKCVSPLKYKNDINNKNDINDINDINNLSSISSNLYYEPINNINNVQIVDNYNDIYENNTKYNIKKELDSNINIEKQYKTNCTSINKLNFSSLKNEPTLTYIQKDKFKLYNYNIMLDTNTNLFLNEKCCDTPCFYCRRKYDFVHLGIPIKYYPSVYILNDNVLQTSKYSFNYKENIIKLNKSERERLIQILNNNPNIVYNKQSIDIVKGIHKIVTRNFFETDGIFCSFNCMISYIEENSYNPIYQNSNHLIYLMYKHIFGNYPNQPFIRSPSWKLRKEYGGPLTDEDYEKYIQTIPIIETKQFKVLNSYYKTESIYEVLT